MISKNRKSGGSRTRILLVYSNLANEPLMPLSIAILSTALQDRGVTVRLFDTTLYPDFDTDDQADRILSQQIKLADYSTVGVRQKTTGLLSDFVDAVDEFRPQLIGVSCVESTYRMALRLVQQIKDRQIPIIFGGALATFDPSLILNSRLVDMVCVGEGENTILEITRRIENGRDFHDIPNVWTKRFDKIIPARKYTLEDINRQPIPRFDIFEPERIYRAMSGKIYRMIPVEISRGCPYRCTYCSAPSYAEKFSKTGRWLRFKSIAQIIKEIDYYVHAYEAEYFYFVSETFLAFPRKERETFYRLYAQYGIPFWFNTRPETINREDIRKLEDIGCHRISVGIESGDEKFRNDVLQRNYTNDQVLKAVEVLEASGIQFSVNNMIGFPDETREMVFETIELNRRFCANSHTVSVFQPYRGTALYDYSVSKGYIDPDTIVDGRFSESVLNMPTLTRDEIGGLYRTFNLYRNFDKSYWPDIRIAERSDENGNKMLITLMNLMAKDRETSGG